MTLTRRGVCYDLNESPYTFTLNYDDKDISFHFSSEFNKDRFTKNYEKFREYYNTSLSKRFGVTINSNELCDIKTYLTYEKRGFYLIIDGEEYSCLENLHLVGMMITKSN